MAAHTVGRINEKELVTKKGSVTGTTELNDSITMESNNRIDTIYAEVPDGALINVSIQLPDSGPNVELLNETATPTTTTFAVSAGRSAPVGSVISITTQNGISGAKKYAACFVAIQ